MWPMFDEMRKCEHSKEQQSKSKKRKSFHRNDKASIQRRKRSLFSTSHLSNEAATVSSPFVASRTCDIQIIGEFSSDDEEDHCLPEGNSGSRNKSTQDKHDSFGKRARDTKKLASLSNSKCAPLSKSQRSSTKATFISTTKQEENTSIIKWSDSDSEHEILDTNKEISTDIDTEQDPIGVFESPVRTLIKLPRTVRQQDDSPVSNEDCKLPTPLDIKQEDLKQEESKESHPIPKLIDSSKKRRYKDIKGGLVELYRKVAARERSNMAFWKHSLIVDKSEMDASIPNEDKFGLCLRVTCLENDLSLSVLKCCKLRNSSSTVYMLLPINTITEHKIEENDILEVFPPFRKIIVKSIQHPVLLCAYFLKVVSHTPEMFHTSQRSSEFDKTENDTQESQFNFSDNNSGNFVSCADNIETMFYKCSLSQPVTFTAIVIKSNLTIRKSQQRFQSNCDESIIDHVKSMCKKGKMENSFELLLILKDENDQIAFLTLLLKDDNAKELCHFAEMKHNLLVFHHFILQDIASISYNPTVLSVIKSLKADANCNFLGDVCYMFSDSEESAISLGTSKISTVSKLSESYQSLSTPSQYQRVSFYGHCLCIIPGIYDENSSSTSTFSFFAVKVEIDYQEDLTQVTNSSKNDNSLIVCIEKLPTCYIPEFVKKGLLDRGKVFFFQDLLECLETKCIILDKLSRLCLVQSENDDEMYSIDDSVLYGTKQLSKEVLNSLCKNNFMLNVKKISLGCETDTVVIVEGTISGIIDDSALFWTVCGKCGLETNEPVIQSMFFCHHCREHVKSIFHVQLEVKLDCKDIPGVGVTVKLLEKTVFEYLPMDISDDFNGYDTECIIGKRFGKKLCYILYLRNQFDPKTGQNSITSINLKEVIATEDVLNYLK